MPDRIGNHIHYVYLVGSEGKWSYEGCDCGARRTVFTTFRGEQKGSWGPPASVKYDLKCRSFGDPVEAYLYKTHNGPPDPPRDNAHEFEQEEEDMAPKMTDKRPTKEPRKTKWELEQEERVKAEQLKAATNLSNRVMATDEEKAIFKKTLESLAEDDLTRRLLADINIAMDHAGQARSTLEKENTALRQQREQQHRDFESYKQGVRDASGTSGTSDTRMFPPRHSSGFGW